MLKPQKPGALVEEVGERVEDFRSVASEALCSGEEAAVFNAALDYAQAKGLTAQEMLPVLSALSRQGTISISCVRAWTREARTALEQMQPSGVPDQLVNRQLQDHAINAAWKHAELVRFLVEWEDRFTSAFNLKLPPAAISVEPLRRGVLGWYRFPRDGMALQYRISFNERHLDRGRADLLSTLLHEKLHQWEHVANGRDRGGSYHSKPFREKAMELGIPSDEKGRSLGVVPGAPFARLLADHGVSLSEAPIFVPPKSPTARGAVPRSALAKWQCGCVPKPTKVWVARGLNVELVCRRCGTSLVRSEQIATAQPFRLTAPPAPSSMPKLDVPVDAQTRQENHGLNQ